MNLALTYDRLFPEHRRAGLEHAMVYLSIAGFAVHLGLVFVENVLANPPAWVAIAGHNYFAAIYTPFSFILFYEVLMLIWALPESTTQSIGKQYEIISLIFIRAVFKDIASVENIDQLQQLTPEAIPVLLDMTGGLGMFFLVTIFRRASQSRTHFDTASEASIPLKQFISRKKTLALGLTLLVVSMAAYHLAVEGLPGLRLFYTDLFTVMIFTDVLVLIFSLLVSDRYELVFRNAAFVISTILIRFSLAIALPYSVALALFGMAFGILTLLVYNYHSRLRAAT